VLSSTSFFLNRTAVALVRVRRLTLRNPHRSESISGEGRMAAVARELPTTGYALEVDGRLKTEFETKEGAWTGAEELKKAFRCSRSKSMTRKQRPKSKSNFHETEI